jgi:serine/threonine protein kinase/HAMP domain-containing protein
MQSDDPDRTVIRPAPREDAGAPAAAAVVVDDATVIKPVTPLPIEPRSASRSTSPASPAPALADTSPRAAAPSTSGPPRSAAPATHPTGGTHPTLPRAPLPKPRTSTALPAGTRLHEYRIDQVLGQGGFGITYLATDVHLNAPVAVKEYLPEDIAFRTSGRTVSPNASRHRDRYRRGLESFLGEARTLASFRHPNIVRVARFFEANDTAYMVLEYEQGSPLKHWWREHGGLPEGDLLLLLRPLLDGLSVVHAAGVLHRDIKPDNIQVRQADGSLVLLDFGSARQAVAGGPQAEVAVTPGYAPIEQYLDDAQGPWTDIYALGATLYWMVAGKAPPSAEERSAQHDPVLPAVQAGQGRFSEAFLKAIDWALQPEAAQRPQTIAEWRTQLFAAHAASLGLQEALRASEAGTGRALMSRSGRAARRVGQALRRAVQPATWPIALKMTLAMILTALLPMSITGYYNLDHGLQALSDSELRNLEELARSTAGRLSQLIGDSENLARMLGADADFRAFLAQPSEASRAMLTAKVAALVQANPDIHLVMVMDAQGTALISNDPEVAGKNFAFREYFKVAMQGRPHVTGIVVGSVAGAAGMFYSQPVFDDAQRVIGAVVLRIRASSFETLLDEAGKVSGRTPFVVDGDGVVILHPDAQMLYSSLQPLPADRMAAIRADHRFRRDTLRDLRLPELAHAMVGAQTLGHASYRSPLSDSDEIAGYAPVQGNDWVVAISEPRARFEQPLRRLFLQLVASVVLVGLLFLGFALRFARSIVRPIQALTRGADALKQGDYAGASVQVSSRDEIGQLARTFNVMIDVLRQREQERGGPR